MPVPVPDVPIIAAEPGGPLRATHVAGSGAMEDRNGSNIVRTAMRKTVNVDIEIYDQSSAPVTDRWDMYRDRHVLVMPRRYGGLCLPVLEAMASGLMVVMSECSPNNIWPAVLVPGDLGKVVKMQTGPVTLFNTHHNRLAATLNHLAKRPEVVASHQRRSLEWTQENTWSALAGRYHDEISHAHSL